MSDPHATSPEDVDLARFDAIVDVRPQAQTRPHLPESTFTPLERLLEDPAASLPSTSARVLVVCDIGMRSAIAARELAELGYQSVTSLDGGIDAWRRHGLPLAGTDSLTPNELERFDRQIKIPDIGSTGQSKLRSASVTVIGAGGLGSPVISYLAGAGIGTLRIVDPDVVELSNLQRQPIFALSDLGRPKVVAAADSVAAATTQTATEIVQGSFDSSSAADLIEGSTVVVDATDSFQARYDLSDATRKAEVPLVTGAVFRWEGQITTLMPNGACYRCIFPSPPESAARLDCALVGAVGPVVGTIGTLQATEVIRISAGLAPAYAGRLLMYDGAVGTFSSVSVQARPDCVCQGP